MTDPDNRSRPLTALEAEQRRLLERREALARALRRAREEKTPEPEEVER